MNVVSSREAQVARLVREGLTTADMAREMTLSVETVRSHIQNLFNKLHISSRDELVSLLNDRPELFDHELAATSGPRTQAERRAAAARAAAERFRQERLRQEGRP